MVGEIEIVQPYDGVVGQKSLRRNFKVPTSINSAATSFLLLVPR